MMKRYWSKDFGPAYFITNTICEWKNMFIFQPYMKLIIDSWKHFQSKRAINFFGFAIMPSHLHYIVLPTAPNYGIIEMQRDFKKFTSRRIIDGLNYELKQGMFNVIDVFNAKGLVREPAADRHYSSKSVNIAGRIIRSGCTRINRRRFCPRNFYARN